jgi:hypothetical protein
MIATGPVLRVVPLLFPCCAGIRRGQAQGRLVRTPRWSDEKRGSESVTPTPFFLLSEAQVQAFKTEPAPG